jgi:hypothetical protein
MEVTSILITGTNYSAFDLKKPNLLQIFTPQNTNLSLQAIIIENKDKIEQILVNFGAILFRGFDINSPSDFNDVAKSFNYGILILIIHPILLILRMCRFYGWWWS